MRILSVHETDWLKGNPAQKHHLLEMLSLRDHEICVMDYEALWKKGNRTGLHSKRAVFNQVSKIYDGAGVTVVRPSFVKIPCIDYISVLFSHRKEIEKQIAEFMPHVIVGWSILNAYLAMKAANRNRIPFIYYLIDVNHRLLPSKLLWPIGRAVESVTLRHADRVLVINDKLKDYVVKLGAPPKRTQVLRAGINFAQFTTERNGEAIRRQYGIVNADCVLFFMGWLYNFSGLKEVALQLGKMQNCDDFKLLIVGEGDAYNGLRQMCDKHNLQNKLILTGKKTYQQIPDFIAAADICLLPAYPREPIMQDIVPIKMYEYMAMKKPVIATRLPGVMKEFGENNGVVYVDKPEDVIGKAIELVQSGNIKDLGEKARRFVEKYSWDNITDEFESILEETVKEKQNERLSKRV